MADQSQRVRVKESLVSVFRWLIGSFFSLFGFILYVVVLGSVTCVQFISGTLVSLVHIWMSLC